ncbi:GNAT family N-acetyltransferase [Candidatus Woesearchaeota archaeon]|nr:GNAT family N-acetyltransferase [Candidatus Woesearchaeota archaeon]
MAAYFDLEDLLAGLPNDTGSKNPVLYASPGNEGVLLWYDAPVGFTTGDQRRRYIEKGDTSLFDNLTGQMRACKPIGNGPDYIDLSGLVTSSVKETDERRGFLNRPYLLTAQGIKAMGLVWQHGLSRTGQNKDRRVMIFHVNVQPEYQRSGIGSEIIGQYLMIACEKYDGVKCSFALDEYHPGSDKFFQRNGFSVKSEDGVCCAEYCFR